MTGIFAVLVLLVGCKKDLDLGPETTPAPLPTSQLKKRSCTMQTHTNRLLQDPNYRQAHQLKFEKVRSMVAERNACTTPVVIPVAVHFQDITNPDAACLRQLAENQIRILNADFQATNDDLAKWTNEAASFFPGISNGETCIRFCLATQNHPSGYELSEGGPAVTINTTTGDFDTKWADYLNIFVQPNLGSLGYSPLGGEGKGDGVVIDANAFGSGNGCGTVNPESPFNLGRTLTHEVGHYLLLDHIWGDGCNVDDEVADTPEAETDYAGCPALGASSCGSADMHMNYMDYTDDACMYVFSAGQSARMENYLSSSLQHLIVKANSVCSADNGGGNTPSCTDGIQNGDESGVDCGGANCPPCKNSACELPNNINAIASSSSAVITFNVVQGATSYQCRYKTQGAPSYQELNTQATFFTINDLQAGTEYEYQIRSICADGNSDYSSTANFSTGSNGDHGSCDCSGLQLDIVLSLDAWGSEVTYELLDAEGAALKTGGPFEDEVEGQLIEDMACLEDGCYTLALYDSFGDGICCEYGEGKLELLDASGAILATSNGAYGFEDYIDFCVENGQFQLIEARRPARSNRVSGKKK